MPPKKHIIIIAVLSMISLGLGYWYGMPKEEGSGGGNGISALEGALGDEPLLSECSGGGIVSER